MKNKASHNIFNSSSEEIYSFFNKSIINSNHTEHIDENFINDALDGYKQNPEAINHISELKNRINTKFQLKQIIVKNIYLVITSLIIVSILSIILIKRLNNNNITALSSINTHEFSNDIKATIIKQSFSFDYENHVKFINILNNQSKKKYVSRKKTYENIEKLTTIGPSEIKIQDESYMNSKDVSLMYYTVSNYPLTYIQDLKTVDYSKFRPSVISYDKFNLGSLSPVYSNYTEKNNSMIEKSEVLMPYRDFLNTALKKFVNQDYSDAIEDFELILDQYKNDANACFYAGLAFYYLGNEKQAIEYLDKAIYNSVNSFDQEAEWYKALALISKKDNIQAKKLLAVIIDKGGFYSNRASQKLKEIK